MSLRTKDDTTVTVRAKLVVDATGHESKLILREDRAKINPPGYQIAYGVFAELDEENVANKDMVGPYDKAAMTLFDYRDDHIPEGDEKKDALKNPRSCTSCRWEATASFSKRPVWWRDPRCPSRPARNDVSNDSHTSVLR